MQKKLIALAVAGLMSGAAFAQTSVTVTGRADGGYMFKRTANADVAGESANYKTTEAQVDGNHGTTEVWIKGKETVNQYVEVGADLNMRYGGGLHEGKTGMSSNDRKSMYISVPFVTLQMGTANLASGEYKLSTKPYAGILGEWEGVKWSISQMNEGQLTNRNTSFWTDPKKLSFGPVAVLFKGTFAGGDSRKAGSSDATDTAGGDVKVLGTEFSLFDKLVTGGYDVSHRDSTSHSSQNGMTWTHAYVSGTPIPKTLKVGAAYNTYKGYMAGSAFDVKTVSLHTSFVISPSFEIGATYARLRDQDTGANDRNSGDGWMIGGNYFLSKSTILYMGMAKQDFESNVSGYTGSKYDGTATNFTAGSVARVDERSLRFGLRKNF